MIDYKSEAEKIARSTAMTEFEGTCVRAVVDLCIRVDAAAKEEAAKVCDDYSCTCDLGDEHYDSCPKSLAVAIRATKGRQ